MRRVEALEASLANAPPAMTNSPAEDAAIGRNFMFAP
ncbi:hypothetical protein BCAR13_920042 [Paraburkholderia caribensis]|nr:hypothetical protein BCAR13_920042 [Paraburkholderia caribensis]